MPVRFFGLTVFLFTAACGGHANTCEEAADYPPSATLVTGEKGKSVVADGDELAIYYGGQGGQHVYVGVETTGLLPDKDSPGMVSFVVLGDDGELLASAEPWIPMKGDAVEARLTGFELSLESPEGSPTGYRLGVTVTDTCGTTATDEVAIQLGW
jgi:hypothetical protein